MHRFVDVLADDASSQAWRQRMDDYMKELHIDDPINIQFTSGTTGLPKVRLFLFNLKIHSV